MHALTVARVGVAVACGAEAFASWRVLARLHQPGILHLPISGLPYVSAEYVPWLISVWVAGSVALAAGVNRAGWIVASCLGYVVLLDEQTYGNHQYLLAILAGLLALPNRTAVIPALKAQLTILYFFAAVSKLNPAFLSGVAIAGALRPQFELLRTPWILVPMALAAIATELFVARMLWTKHRTTAALAGVGLHLGCVLLMDSTLALTIFAVACLSLYPLFWLVPESAVMEPVVALPSDLDGTYGSGPTSTGQPARL